MSKHVHYDIESMRRACVAKNAARLAEIADLPDDETRRYRLAQIELSGPADEIFITSLDLINRGFESGIVAEAQCMVLACRLNNLIQNYGAAAAQCFIEKLAALRSGEIEPTTIDPAHSEGGHA